MNRSDADEIQPNWATNEVGRTLINASSTIVGMSARTKVPQRGNGEPAGVIGSYSSSGPVTSGLTARVRSFTGVFARYATGGSPAGMLVPGRSSSYARAE